MTDIIHKELGYKIMNLAFTVHRELGPGLLESAYEEGLAWEFKHANIPFEETSGVLVFSILKMITPELHCSLKSLHKY